jgi:hypothetical protein
MLDLRAYPSTVWDWLILRSGTIAAMVGEQNVPVPFSADGFRIGSHHNQPRTSAHFLWGSPFPFNPSPFLRQLR